MSANSTHDGSPAKVFAWTGAILGSVAFITLISWGAATWWPLGFTICAVYSVLLFLLADHIFRRNENREEQPQDRGHMELVVQRGGDSDAPVEALVSDAARKTPISVSLLYGMAVVGLGVTGAFLFVNLFKCPSPDYRSNQQPTDCNEEIALQKKAFLALLVTGSPMIFVSVRLWIDKGIPSMAVTTLVGINIIYLCLHIILWPTKEEFEFGSNLWHSLAGATWTFILSRLLLFTQLRKSPLVWGINFGGLCFHAGTTALLYRDHIFLDLWRCIAIFFVCDAPLFVFGMGTGCILLVILGAYDLFRDVIYVGINLSSKVPGNLQVPVFVVVMAVGSIGIGAAGYWLQQRQEEMKAMLKRLLECLWKTEDATYVAAPAEENLLYEYREADIEKPRSAGDKN